MAVAIWDKKPNADELLQARIENGWKPTLSALKSGPTVLGHARCLVDKP